MQQINNLVNQAAQQIASGPETRPEQQSGSRLYRIKGKLLTVTEILWERFTDVYGATFTKQFGENPSEGWELAVSSLTPEMIRKGLSRMATDPEFKTFPPKALEFRALCLPTSEELGLPSAEESFQQAVGNRTTKHPATIYTLRQMDSHALRRMDLDSARKLWAKQWASTVDHVAAGGELPDVEPEIEHKPIRAAPDKAKPYMDQLMGMLA